MQYINVKAATMYPNVFLRLILNSKRELIIVKIKMTNAVTNLSIEVSIYD